MNSAQTIWKRVFSTVALLVLILTIGQPTLSADAHPQTQSGPQPITFRAVKVGISLPLSQLPKHPALSTETAAAPESLPSLPNGSGASLLPAPINVMNGISNADNQSVNGTDYFPPDTSGDIGPSHYIQAVNNLFEIWSPTNYQSLDGPWPINFLFKNFGGMCENNEDGSPIVLYDHLADRWLISQMAKDDVYPGFEYHQCIAVSSGPDPVADPWYLYDFQIQTVSADMYAAPKLAVWSNGYYMTLDQYKYNSVTSQWVAAGQGAAVLERDKMLVGQNARIIYFDLYPSTVPNKPPLGKMLPVDLDGVPPKADTPGLFIQIDDNNRVTTPVISDQLEIWQLDVTWANNFAAWGPAKESLPVDPFNSVFSCNTIASLDCVPQPGATTAQYLDVAADRLMYRAQYRFQDGAGHIVVNHTVNAGSDKAAIRWYHLQTDVTNEWTVADQGTFSPDANSRWMGSAAMDASGNIAVGYSVSSSTVNPSIRYAGRLASDPAGQLSQGEVSVVAGSGIQTDPSSRWGDYSTMSVDPANGCTFWYTNEYIGSSGVHTWATKIAKFDLGPGTCTEPVTYTISGSVTDALSGSPVENAVVRTDTGFMAKTDANGIYTLRGLPADAVAVTATALGHLAVPYSGGPVTPPAVDINFALSRSDDDISGALVINSVPYLDTPDTSTASQAADDPLVTACGLGAGSATLWYKYTPPADSTLYIDTLGSDYDTFLAVWMGSRGSLDSVACNNNANGSEQSALTVPVVHGTDYYIEVGQSTMTAPTGGNLKFHLTTFADVQGNYWAWRYIEGLAQAKVTGGCSVSPMLYCPGATVTRDQMAVFILRAEHGPSYVPPAATGVFEDVPTDYWAASWIETLYAEGITGGCLVTPKRYCPGTPVTRDQMSVFLLRAKHGAAYNPPAPTGVFLDVPTNYWAASWIEQLAAENITGGCGADYYCPGTPVTRDQMAVFLVRTMSLPLVP